MMTIEFVQLLDKTLPFGTNTIVNEIKSQGQCTKDVRLFSLVVQLFVHMKLTCFRVALVL